jgi:subtilisin family serine protease
MSGYAHAADASAFETPEYFAGRGLNAINASAAYAKGYTGQGVTVGISDEPISFASPEFSTKRNSSYAPGFYPTFEDEDGTVYTVKDPDYWSIFAHATFLAGIVAASRNGLGMHGVAFDAEVRSSVFFEKYTLEDGGGHVEWLAESVSGRSRHPGCQLLLGLANLCNGMVGRK